MLAEKFRSGKTKTIKPYTSDNPNLIILESKDDLTAFNKAKHDIVSGKAIWANQTTCNVFRFLSASGIPVAFTQQLDEKSFVAPYCQMIPYEVIVRRSAHGSYLKRHPYLKKGHVFPKLIVEFFLKTTDQLWQGTRLDADDPYIQFHEDYLALYKPNQPLDTQEPFLMVRDFPLKDQRHHFKAIADLAKKTFLLLEKAWHIAGGKLADFKVEFGFDAQGNLLLADVIDNDSWRVIQHGDYLDKQFYRDGGALDEVSKRYRYVCDLTARFTIPHQQLIIWRGSDKDDVAPFIKTFEKYCAPHVTITTVTQSMHKDPIGSYQTLAQLIQEVPDSVVIAFVGRSNGAGPTLSANTVVPVITVPYGWQQFPEDVWSSLRGPSNVPVMTVLDPHNAFFAALNILASHNPYLYAHLHLLQEGRLKNIVELPDYYIPATAMAEQS